jgi:NAD(P)-dependent dehydrogenase (short-subunit alcohol dehydrogenase family)
MAKAGFRVVATMRNLERRTRLDEAVTKANVTVEVRQLDVNAMDSLPDKVAEIGQIDVLVNNAGFVMAGFAEDLRLAEIREQFETNFFGAVALTLAVLPQMRERKSGHVIMVSSASGLSGQPVASCYSASKFALEGWSESLRLETACLGIRVVLVEPGAYESDIWEKNLRIGQDALGQRSPNFERIQRYAEFVKTRVKKRDATEVARLIARVAQDPEPRLRYVVGQYVHVQRLLRACLPWHRYEKMLRRISGIG